MERIRQLKQDPPSAPLLLVSAHHSDFEELVMYVRGGEGGLCCGGPFFFFLVNFGCKFVEDLVLFLLAPCLLVSARDYRLFCLGNVCKMWNNGS